MKRAEEIFDWCLKQGAKGEEHRGIRKITPNVEEARTHIEKAEHNLEAFQHCVKGGFSDWAVSAAFYAMYHASLAILFKLGYESRNQECTISAIESLAKQGKIEFDQKYIEMIRQTSVVPAKDAKMLREEFQYGTKVSVDEEVLKTLKQNAFEFVEAARVLLEKLEK